MTERKPTERDREIALLSIWASSENVDLRLRLWALWRLGEVITAPSRPLKVTGI